MDYGFLLFMLLLTSAAPRGATPPAPGPAVTLTQVFAGGVVPLTYTPDQLHGAWVTLRTAPANAEVLTTMIAHERQDATQLTYYTRGQTLNVEGAAYLVAYLPQQPPGPPRRAALSPHTRLALSLLALDTLPVLSEVRTLNVKAAMAEPPLTEAEVRQEDEFRLHEVWAAITRGWRPGSEPFPTLSLEMLCANFALSKNATTEVWTGEPFLLNHALDGVTLPKDADRDEIVVAYSPPINPYEMRMVLTASGAVISRTPQSWRLMCGCSPYPPLTPAELAARHVERLHQLGTVLLRYAREHDATFPPLRDPNAMPLLLKAYGWTEELTAGVRFNYKCSARALKAFPDRAAVVLAAEIDPAADGTRTVLFADGHAAHVDAAEWKKLEPTLGK